MKIFRSVLSGLAAFICLSSIIGLVYLFTLQATVMDRSVVKEWLNDSNIYEGNLITSLIQPAEASDVQTVSAINATPDMIKSALNATFTPVYIREQTNVVIDSAYDWIEGVKPDFFFSIPIDQKRDDFIQQLAQAIEPQIATMPICGMTQNATCRPANITTEQFALQITQQSIDESGALTAPITPATLSGPTQQPGTSTLTQLPALRKTADLLFVVLPILIVLSALATTFTVQSNRRMHTSIKLSRRVLFSMTLTVVTALLIILVLYKNYFDLSQILTARVGDLIAPLIKIIVVDIAINLALFGGIAGVIAAVVWVVLHFIEKNGKTPSSNFSVTSIRY